MRRALGRSVVALAALALALHAPLLRGEALACWTLLGASPPWNERGGPFPNAVADFDPVALELPAALHARASGGARWNPLLGLGEPCGTADWPTLDHPLARLAYVRLPPWLATGVLSLLHVAAGGVAALLYLRWRGHGPRAALLAAIAYELSPFFSAWLARPMITAVMPFAPLVLWAAEALARRPGARPMAGLGLATGGALLVGFPQLALLVAGLAPPLAAARAARGARGRALGLALAGVALGALLAAPRLLPLSALMEASSRAPIPWPEWFERTARLEPSALLGAIVPDARGHPCRGGPLERIVGRTPYENYQELRLYLGLPALALLLAGAGRAGTRPHLALALLALALALPTALAWPLWAIAPGFRGTSPTRVLWVVHVLALPMVAAGAGALLRGERAPGRAAGALLAVAALAALALGAREPALLGPLGRGPHPAPGAPPGVHVGPRGAWPGGPWMLAPTLGPLLLAAATLAAAGLAARSPGSPARRRAAAAALLALLAWDLLREARAYGTSSPPGAYYPPTPATQAARAASTAAGGRALVAPPLQPTVLAPSGVPAVGSYGSLHSARLVALLGALGSSTPLRQYVDPSRLPPAWRDALSVAAVLVLPGRPSPGEAGAPGLALVHDGPDARVWARAGALPRARLHPVEAVVQVSDVAAGLAVTRDPAFDPRRHVLLETERAGAGPFGAAPAAQLAAPTAVALLADEAERVVVRVDAPGGGVLVLADAFAPGWSCAAGDGRPLELRPAQVALRGVLLPAGFAGEVTFTYAPPRRAAGLAVGLLALLVTALVLRPCAGGAGLAR